MANIHMHTWKQFDSLWQVAGYYLAASGFRDTPTFVSAIQNANPTILDWQNVATGTSVTLPYLH